MSISHPHPSLWNSLSSRVQMSPNTEQWAMGGGGHRGLLKIKFRICSPVNQSHNFSEPVRFQTGKVECVGKSIPLRVRA